jgi:hypothetical protein
MKKAFILISSVLSIFLANTGCQKEVPASILGDSTNISTTQALRRIKVHHPSVNDPYDAVFSLQYDTAGRKINVYLDDTTTSNPLDLLAINYQFDANGYLVSSNSIEYDGTFQPDFVITRNGSGQIQKIIEYNAEEANGIPYDDTVYYSYQQSAGKTTVQDSVRFHFNPGFSTRRTDYNSQNNPLVEYGYFGSTFKTYNYNNGVVSNIITPNDPTYYPGNDTAYFTYDNTPVASQWQGLPQLLLGKDYYILQQEPQSYNFLSFIMEFDFETVYNPLLTKPLSKIIVRGYPYSNANNFLIKTINLSYTYTPDKLPSNISVIPDGGSDPTYYTFEYK